MLEFSVPINPPSRAAARFRVDVFGESGIQFLPRARSVTSEVAAMSKTPRKQPKTDHANETANPTLAGTAQLLANWNYSLGGFYARRFQRYWQFPFELAEMRSLEAVALSLIEFETELLADYADQADEFQRIVGENGRQAPGSRGQVYEAQLLKAQKDAASIIEQAKAQAERIVNSARSRAEQMTGDEILQAARKASHG